jgi:lipopolysaccharide export system permease protein
MIVAATLSRYIARQFTWAVLIMTASLAGLVSLFDFIELLRRSVSKPEATLGLITEIAALRLPWMAMEILPFAVLLGGIVAFWRLTRSSELIVARAAGLSAWQFLSAAVLAATLMGAIATTAVSPLSSAMFARAEMLDNSVLKAGGGPLALAGGQLWLRQSDRAIGRDGVAILHALGVSLHGRTLLAKGISIFRIGAGDKLAERIEAKEARLDRGVWVLGDAHSITPDRLPSPARTMRLKTDLTVSRVEESFASPETLSFWKLPDFIALLDRSGFSSVRHRLHFQTLLALPLLAATMTLVAAGFSMRPARRGGVAQMLASGVSAGFALFLISKVAAEYGNSGALPVTLAAWAPALSGLLLAVALLLHLEDG